MHRHTSQTRSSPQPVNPDHVVEYGADGSGFGSNDFASVPVKPERALSVSRSDRQSTLHGHKEMGFSGSTSGSLVSSASSLAASPSGGRQAFATPRSPSTRSIASVAIGSPHRFDPTALYQLITKRLYSTGLERSWFSLDESIASGVAVHVGQGKYSVFPEGDPRLAPFTLALGRMATPPPVAFIFSTPEVQAIASGLDPDLQRLQLGPDEALPVVDTMEEVAGIQFAFMACLVRREGKVIVWCHSTEDFEVAGEAFHVKLTRFIWGQTLVPTPYSPYATPGLRSAGPLQDLDGSFEEFKDKVVDSESQASSRPMRLNSALYTGLGVALNVVLCAAFIRLPFQQCLLDGNWQRMLIGLVLPPLFLVLLFLCDNIVSVIMQCLAPIARMRENSLYYSGQAPKRLRDNLPHVTIMMPVYKESLRDVLAPTILSLQTAIRTYERQGGSANILVCEDGLQLVDETERVSREIFYGLHNCAYVARHPQGRAGRFKKSSNLNVAHRLSLRIEELMLDENLSEGAALQQALLETEGRVWAAGNVRIGEFILLVDSDTRIPEDSLIDSASELAECPEVAILQHCSGTFLAGAGYFESGMAYFTKMVNFQISWACSNGGTSPFMGHNAFLRWSALQNQSWVENEKLMIWSEEHVSEDFLMSVNLVSAGYVLRWATYSKNGFLEGVSLTCDDELNRWQKYAFGCSELVFNPVKRWFTRSPFTKKYGSFLWGPTPLSGKFTTSSYVVSYWAIASSAPVTLAMYPILLCFADDLDASYTRGTAFNIWLTILFVYVLGGTLGSLTARMRSGEAVGPTLSNLRWVPFFVVFFGGMSWHVFFGLMAHITGYNMTWSSTVKDLQQSTVTSELIKIVKRWWGMYIVFVLFIAGVIATTTPLLPLQWRMTGWAAIFPSVWVAVGHLVYPLLLSPAITSFRF